MGDKLHPPFVVLSAFLQDKDLDLRCTAIIAVAGIGDTDGSALAAVIAAMTDKSERVRINAVEVLSMVYGKHGSEEAINAAQKLKSEDPVDAIRQAAATALIEMGLPATALELARNARRVQLSSQI